MSETYEHKKLHTNENVKWYKLNEEAKNNLLRLAELTNDGYEKDKPEISLIREALGQRFAVTRNDIIYGYSAHAPEIYASPLPHEDDFYMMCPIGSGRKDEKTYFVPSDCEELDKETIEKITNMLFAAWGGSIPVLHKEPIQLMPPETPSSHLEM